MWLELAPLYWGTLLAVLTTAPLMSFMGVQLATQDRALQCLCLGQGAVAGVLLGMGLQSETHLGWLTLFPALPLVTGILSAALAWKFADRLVRSQVASKNTYFAALFAFLIASGHLVSAFFPAVENHMAQVYFGDLVTLAHADSLKLAAYSLVVLIFVSFTWRRICLYSVDRALAGGILAAHAGPVQKLFAAFSLVTLCIAVQYLGYLYTLSLLFLPTAILSYRRVVGLRSHLVLCALLATTSALLGFGLSLEYTRLPTVPAIVACLLFQGALWLGLERVWLRVSGRSGRGADVLGTSNAADSAPTHSL